MEVKSNSYEAEKVVYKNKGITKQDVEKKKMMRAPAMATSTLSASSMASSRPVSNRGGALFSGMAVKERRMMD